MVLRLSYAALFYSASGKMMKQCNIQYWLLEEILLIIGALVYAVSATFSAEFYARILRIPWDKLGSKLTGDRNENQSHSSQKNSTFRDALIVSYYSWLGLFLWHIECFWLSRLSCTLTEDRAEKGNNDLGRNGWCLAATISLPCMRTHSLILVLDFWQWVTLGPEIHQ